MGHGADLIKVIATGAVLAPGTNPGAPEFTEDEISAAVDEAGNYGAFVAAHAHGAEGIKRATRAGVRSIEHGSFADDESLALMAERGTYLVADVWAGDWMEEEGTKHDWPADTMKKIIDTTETQRDAFRRALAHGVRIGFGTDSGIYPHGMNIHQLAKHVELGMSPMAALRSATLWASECLGNDEVGVLIPGPLRRPGRGRGRPRGAGRRRGGSLPGARRGARRPLPLRHPHAPRRQGRDARPLTHPQRVRCHTAFVIEGGVTPMLVRETAAPCVTA